MGTAWCKVSASLDSHPAIRKAGNLGRQIFEFALRRNAELDRNGVIPAAHLDPEYLAETLMLDSPDQAAEGVSRCVRTGLLARDTRDSTDFVICGWDDEWGKRPMTEAERKRNQRAKSRKETTLREVTEVSGHDRDRPDSHGSDQRREEEIRSGDALPRATKPSPEPAGQPAAVLDLDAVTALAKQTWARVSDARMALAKKHSQAGVLPLVVTPGNVRGFADLKARIREEGAEAARVCDHVVTGLVEQAELEKSVEWLSEKAFTPGGWRTARSAVLGKPKRAGPKSSAARAGERNPVLQNLLDDIAAAEAREKANGS